MLSQIFKIFIVILLNTSSAFSQTIDDAGNVINKFCHQEIKGYRLYESKSNEISKYVPGYKYKNLERFNIITGYHVQKCIVQGGKAEAEIVFYKTAQTFPLRKSKRDEWVKINLELDDKGKWIIVSPLGIPYVSIDSYEDMLKNQLNEENISDIDAQKLKDKITLVSEIKTDVSTEIFKIKPEEKDLELGLTPEEINIPIDTTIVLSQDLTFDGQPEEILIHVKGDSQVSPFTWSAKIRSDDNTIFLYLKNDLTSNDQFFRYDYVDQESKTYIEAKRRYYYKFIPEWIIKYAKFTYPSSVVDRNAGFGAYHTVLDQLVNTYGMESEKAEVIADRVENRLKTGAYFLSIPDGTFVGPSPRIYVEEVGAFLVFYRS